MWSKLSYTNTNNDQHESKKQYFCKSVCIIAAIIFVALIFYMTYFNGPSTANPTQNLLKKKRAKRNNHNINSDDTASIPVISLPPETNNNNDETESFYATEIDLDPNREIIKSDKTMTSAYYKSNGYDDLIKSMPNLLEITCVDSASNCGFNQYSGYLLANNNREIHYWFIEAEQNPHQKPLLIWTNGGPGCSGMDGLFTEHGPWRVLKNGNIGYNKYSWINEVNIVYLEQPYGVGFSVTGYQNIIGGDQHAADDMDAAIRDFLTKFPSFNQNIIYLSSESWGGHYVPITSYIILKNNENGVLPNINFGGFLLGNPSTDPYENKYGFVGDIYGHGLLKSDDWYRWRDECWSNAQAIDTSEVCAAIHTRAYYSAFNSNVYALDYPQCYGDQNWNINDHDIMKAIQSSKFMKNAHLHHQAIKSMQKVLLSNDYKQLKMGHITRDELQIFHDKINERLNRKTSVKPATVISAKTMDETMTIDEEKINMETYEPCIEYFMTDYLNLEEVQTALNVKPVEWIMCSDAVWHAWPDSDFENHMEPYYTNIIHKYADKLGLRLTIYSGDDDSVCGLEGTMYWLDRFEFDAHDDIEWQPWTDKDNQLGGYYTQYMDDKDNVVLHFITIRSAGHMVPTTQPSRALTILRKFLYEFSST